MPVGCPHFLPLESWERSSEDAGFQSADGLVVPDFERTPFGWNLSWTYAWARRSHQSPVMLARGV